MTDHLVQSAAITLGNWRSRRGAKGHPSTEEDLRVEAAGRWPMLTNGQIEEIVRICQKPRDER